MPTIPSPSWIRQLAGSAALALIYYAGARLGLLLDIEPTHLVPFWPPAGLALGGLLIFGWRTWPGVWLGALAANCEVCFQIQGENPAYILWVTTVIASGNTLEALAGWFLCTRWLGLKGEAGSDVRSPLALGKVSEFGFVAVAAAVSLVSVAVGTTVVYVAGNATWQANPFILFMWWTGGATGILYFTPLLLAWLAFPFSLRNMRVQSETAAAFTVLALCCAVVFLWYDRDGQAQNYNFLAIGPMVWIAIRSGLRATTAGLVLLGIFAIVGLQHQAGAGAREIDLPEIFALQAFLWVVGVTSLTLTRRVAAQRRAQVTIAETDHALAATIEAIPALVWVAHDPKCHRVTGNPAAQAILEMPLDVNVSATPPAPRALPFVMSRDGKPLPTDELPMQLAIATRKPVLGVELDVNLASGKVFHLYGNAVPLFEAGGAVTGCVAVYMDMSEQKRTGQALREADQKLRLHFEQSPMGTIEWDVDFRVTRWNPAAQMIFGYTSEEAVGRHASFIVPEVFRPHVDQIWQALKSKSGGERSTNENVCRDGGTILCEWFNTPLIDERGTFTGAASLVQDITARKELEDVLASTADLLERTGEMAKVGGWELDLASMKHTWSLATCRILEVDPPEAPPVDQGISFYVPEARPIIRAAVQAAIEHGTPYDLELQVITAKGRAIWVRAQGHAVVENGKTIKLVGALHDVTERRQAEQLLGWEKNAMELISSARSLSEVLAGLTLDLEKQLPGSLCSVLLLDADGVHLRHGAAPNLPEAYNRAVDGGVIGPAAGSCGTAAYLGRQIIVTDIGSDPLWADYRELALGHGLRACFSTPILANEEKVLGTFAIYYPEPRHPLPEELAVVARAVHITRIAIERKQAEAALRESETKYRMLFEMAGDAIFLTEGELCVDCNSRALEMFGCVSRDQIVGQPPYRFSPPFQPSGQDSREAAIEKLSAALSGQPQAFEWMNIRLDGTPFPAAVSLSAVEVGGRVLLQAIVHDITDRRKAEEALQRLNAELELRVASRTSALLQTNDELNREIVERRRLEKDLVTISEREQRRLGEDLHERLGSQLAGMGFLCQVLAGRLQAEIHPQAGAAAELNELLKESLDAARNIAHSSYPVELDTGGLFVAVQGLADRTSQIYGVQCELRCKRRHLLHHDGEVAIHLYRIIQEAVTNAIRHGQATSIVIECRETHGVNTIAITNDGAAFAENGRSEGMGLHLMRHRARLVGAEIELRRPEEGGFEVLCRFKAA